MEELNKRQEDLLVQLLIEKIEALDFKLDAHMNKETNEIKELTAAFNSAKSIVWFIKWIAVIGSSVALTWAWLSNHFTIGIK